MSAGLEDNQVVEQDQDQGSVQLEEQNSESDIQSPEVESPAAEAESTESEPTPETISEPETPPEPENDRPDWVDEDQIALAASYGLSEEEVAGFESAHDFQRACRMIDRHLSGAGPSQGRDDGSEQQDQVQQDQRDSTSAAAESPSQPPAPLAADDLTIDLAQYEGYDDETLRVVKVAKHLQDQNRQFQETLERIQQERFQEAHYAELSRFHEEVDQMDKGLFGGEDALTAETDGRRKSLWDAYHTVKQTAMKTAKQDGRPPKLPPMKTLLRRAALFAFGDEILAAEKKANSRAISSQAKKRRPSPGKGKVLSTAAPNKADAKTIHEAAQEIVNSPEIASIFDKYEEENGNAPSGA